MRKYNKKLISWFICIVLIFNALPLISASEEPVNEELSFDVSFSSESLNEGLFTASISAMNLSDKDINSETIMAFYSADHKLKKLSIMHQILTANKTTEYSSSIDIQNVNHGDKLKLFVWSTNNSLKPLSGTYEVSAPVDSIYDTFEDISESTRLSTIQEVAGWKVTPLYDTNDTNFIPSLGKKLYAEIKSLPEISGMESGNALYLYDNVGKVNNEVDGAGSIIAYRALPEYDKEYTISFDMYVPDNVGKNQWGGFALTHGVANNLTYADTPCALQVRFSPQENGEIVFNRYESITYNEGSEKFFLGLSGNRLKYSTPWKFTLHVNPVSKTIKVTVEDGMRTLSKVVNYNILDAANIETETWDRNRINHIQFNTGANTSGEMYIDNFKVTHNPDIVYPPAIEQNFENLTLGTRLSEFELIDNWGVRAIKEELSFANTYTASLGTKLFADISNLPQAAGLGANNKAIRLYDRVGRNTDLTAGAGGLMVYRPLPELDSKYIIKFKMFVPTINEVSSWAGFSLTNGLNKGKGDTEYNPCAFQLRFSPQSENQKMQFNTLDSTTFNVGSVRAFLGTGNNRFLTNRVWDFEITVNPLRKVIEVKASDGFITHYNRSYYNSSGANGNEDWSSRKINYIIFNTGAGDSDEIYIDDFQLIDTRKREAGGMYALNSVCRLEGYSSSVTYAGYFIRHKGKGNQAGFARDVYNIKDTRFIERPGLIDPNYVSLESLNNPGYYLKVRPGDLAIVLEEDNGSTDFRRLATFKKVKGLKDGVGVSYQSYVYTTRYIKKNGDALSAELINDDTARKESTFYVRSEAEPYLYDQFNGTALDESKWAKNYLWGDYHNYSAVVRRSQVTVSDGKVHLKAERSESGFQNDKGEWGYMDYIGGSTWRAYKYKSGAFYAPPWRYLFNSGCYIEGRFKMPSESGFWPAFWLNGRDSWPPEIDIMEYLTEEGWKIHSTVHRNNNGSDASISTVINTSFDPKGDYHTYAIDWNDARINFYFDDILVFSVKDTTFISNQKNMYMIVNLGVGGWAQEPSASSATFRCDYIRSYVY